MPVKVENEKWRVENYVKLSTFKSQISTSLGFTLIELLVAISIVAILSVVGIAVFSNVSVKARDTTRKNALKQIQIALELYYEETGKYPTPPSSPSSSDECTKIEKGTLDDKLDKYLKDPPKDPKQSEDPEYKYCYKLESNGEYLLSAKLENCEESNVNKEACTYVISSDESYIAQAPIIPKPRDLPDAVTIPNPISNPFNRPAPITPITEFQDPGVLPVSSTPGVGTCAWIDYMEVEAVVFADTFYNSAQWPDYRWRITDPGRVCSNPEYITGAKECEKQSDCSDDDACTNDECVMDNRRDDSIGYCKKSVAFGSSCQVGGTDGFCGVGGACVTEQRSCNNNNDCNDSNVCTTERCVFTSFDEESGEPRGVGYCSFSNQLGLTCASGQYCDSGGQCTNTACKTNSDCSDSNACTSEDRCFGYRARQCDDDNCTNEVLGVCLYNNRHDYEVCAQNTASQPVKMCQSASTQVSSQCSLNYASCTNPTATPANSSNTCCGTTNIQGKLCKGECYVNHVVEGSGIRNAVVRIKGDLCGLSFTAATGANGIAVFNIPWRVQQGRVYYDISVDIPSDVNFTRGTCYNGTGYDNPINLVRQYSTNQAACSSSFTGSTTVGFTSTFGFKK